MLLLLVIPIVSTSADRCIQNEVQVGVRTSLVALLLIGFEVDEIALAVATRVEAADRERADLLAVVLMMMMVVVVGLMVLLGEGRGRVAPIAVHLGDSAAIH